MMPQKTSPLVAALLGAAVVALTGCSVDGSYPADVRSSYLANCGVYASGYTCSCMLNWLENNVSYGRFLYDAAQIRAGNVPANVLYAAAACGG